MFLSISSPRLAAALVLVVVVALLLPVAASADEGKPPLAPSHVTAVTFIQEGTSKLRVSWTDNADNELRFRVVDQNRPSEVNVQPAEGTGKTVSVVYQFASGCFRVYAYNANGRS